MALKLSSPAGGTYVLKTGAVCHWHDRLYGDPATNTVTPSPVDETYIFLGFADRTGGRTISVDETITGNGTITVGCAYGREIPGQWIDNTDADLFDLAYRKSDGTATSTDTGNPALGRVLDKTATQVFVAFSF